MEAAVPTPSPFRTIGRYWMATRPYSYTAAVVPVFIGIAVARLLFPAHPMQWLAISLTVAGAISIQAVSNVVNDLYDARCGLDNQGNYGRMNALVSGLVTVKEAKGIILAATTVALLIGGYFVVTLGGPILWLLMAGLVLAFGYTAPPLKLKFHALGDMAVLLGFGFGMALGAYIVQAFGQPGYLEPAVLLRLILYCLPSALLVVAILHTNNHRDRANDLEYGARTLSNLLTSDTSKRLLVALLITPYVLATVAILIGAATPLWGLAFLSVPALLKILMRVRADEFGGMLVPDVAKLHGMFGILTVVAIKIATSV
ncbi:prenyltransferase [bacterium]|nr:MAG: prenyltransferase [bacterium]